MAIAGKLGGVYRANGTSVSMTAEPTTKDAAYKVYTITNAAHRYLDMTQAITVKKNGTTVATNLYTVDFAGQVVFNSANIVTDTVTIDGKYIPLTQCATFFDWKLDIDIDLKDVTTFASGGWAEKVALNKNFSGSCEGYWADASYLTLMDQPIVLILYVDAAGFKRYEGIVILNKNGIETPSDDVVKESLDFAGTGALNYREG